MPEIREPEIREILYMPPRRAARRWWRRPESRWWVAAAQRRKKNMAAIFALQSARGKTIQYIEFGFTSAREYWDEVLRPAYECFKAEPSRGKAIMASFPAWHIQDWIWHDQHPGEDTRNNKDHQLFQEKLFLDCPALQWIRDVADAGKHRGLGRQNPKVEVREVKGMWPRNAIPLIMKLDDGTQHDFAGVLEHVIEFWRTKYFP
jgi:hypothetical protein